MTIDISEQDKKMFLDMLIDYSKENNIDITGEWDKKRLDVTIKLNILYKGKNSTHKIRVIDLSRFAEDTEWKNKEAGNARNVLIKKYFEGMTKNF